MARYIQKIQLGGRERWLGWEVDGVGTEVAGLTLADGIPEDELLARGVRKFFPMSFDDFVGLGAMTARVSSGPLDDQDLEYRFDALQVALDRFHAHGFREIPRLFLDEMFGESIATDPRIEARLLDWEQSGAIQLERKDDAYIRILRRFS